MESTEKVTCLILRWYKSVHKQNYSDQWSVRACIGWGLLVGALAIKQKVGIGSLRLTLRPILVKSQLPQYI